MAFDCNSPAELYMPKRKSIGRRAAPRYRRFATAAEAIRFGGMCPVNAFLGGRPRADSSPLQKLPHLRALNSAAMAL